MTKKKVDSELNIQFTEEQKRDFIELANYRMPFGKHRGQRLVDLPEPYVVWFRQQGFPEGKLGRLLAIVYEIKANGLEYLFPDPG
jgi:hypothetical protein